MRRFFEWLTELFSGKKKQTPQPEKIYANYKITDFDYEVMGRINQHRHSLGLSILSFHPHLSNVAADHSVYMAGKHKPSHDYFTERAKEFKDHKTFKETVAYNYKSPEYVVKNWIASDKHRAAIETPNLTHVGVGHALDTNGRKYVTANFIGD